VTAGAVVAASNAGAPSNCCVPHAGPGCDDPQCMLQVCQILPHCCNATWDGGCAATAQNVCGPLCIGDPPIHDTLATSDDGPTIVQFGSPGIPPIPPDFFHPGSAPFMGVIVFTGKPLSVYDNDGDTIIQRFGDPVFPFDPPGAFGQVPIEIVSLNLVSINPIIVSGQQWDVTVTLSGAPPPPPGSLQVQKTHPNGGVFTAQFNVLPRFTFTQVQDPAQVRVLDAGKLGLPPLQLQTGEGQWVHNVNPDLNVVTPGPDSFFIPGILETVPGDIQSQQEAIFTAQSSPSGVTHTVCPAYFKQGRCEVTAKGMPAGAVPCGVVNNGNGTKNITAPFAMTARFRDNCACCEFRQYVKGEFKLKGKVVPKLLEPGVLLDKNVFREDGFGAVVPAGANQHYGHRSDPNNPVGDRYLNPANRATGCNYAGTDAPGWYRVKNGTAYSIDLTFQGFIIDTCNQVSLAPVHTWTVNCAGVALGGPDPLVEVLIETVINGRGAVLGVYRYPGQVLTVIGSISNGLGEPFIDAAEVDISVAGLAVIDSPGPGELPQSVNVEGGATAHALYDFDYPPGSPATVQVSFTYGPETQQFDVLVAAPCLGDIDGDGSVGIVDFLTLLGGWGPCPVPCPPCPADLDGDCQVGILDFLTLLGAWGPCPLSQE
jgi:hypothetical protein